MGSRGINQLHMDTVTPFSKTWPLNTVVSGTTLGSGVQNTVGESGAFLDYGGEIRQLLKGLKGTMLLGRPMSLCRGG